MVQASVYPFCLTRRRSQNRNPRRWYRWLTWYIIISGRFLSLWPKWHVGHDAKLALNTYQRVGLAQLLCMISIWMWQEALSSSIQAMFVLSAWCYSPSCARSISLYGPFFQLCTGDVHEILAWSWFSNCTSKSQRVRDILSSIVRRNNFVCLEE